MAGAVLQRQPEHRHVAVDLAGAEGGEPGERQRDDEDVDEDEVEREQPGEPAHVLDAAVLDHRHVELARQEERGAAGEQRQRDEGAGLRGAGEELESPRRSVSRLVISSRPPNIQNAT